MPWLWDVSWIIEECDADNQLRGNNCYASADSNPRENIGDATEVALSKECES